MKADSAEITLKADTVMILKAGNVKGKRYLIRKSHSKPQISTLAVNV